MAKKDKHRKGPNYNCEAFHSIKKNVQLALQTSKYTSESSFGDSLTQDLADKVFHVLISETIIDKEGKVKSEGRYVYIREVLPFFGQHELRVLENDPKDFASRFCLHPSRKDGKSLALLLYYNEDKNRVFSMGREWIESKLPLFGEFREFSKEDPDDPEDYGLSPFERVTDPYILGGFLSKDESLYY